VQTNRRARPKSAKTRAPAYIFDGRWISRCAGLAGGHAENAQKIRSATKDLRDLRQAFHMAQEMGEGLGGGALLFGQVSRDAQLNSSAHVAYRKLVF